MIKSFFRAALYYVVKGLCFSALKVYNRLKISGRELIPDARPVIVAANHASNLDPVVVGGVFPGRLRPLGKVQLFRINRPFTWLMNNLGVIPLDRESGASAAGRLIDATKGRKTRAIVVTDSNHVLLSAIQPETIVNRISEGDSEDEDEA